MPSDGAGGHRCEIEPRPDVTLQTLEPCAATDAAFSRAIIYPARRGTCLDCELPNDQWSGFAFIIVYDRSGHELASAEWQGEGAGDGHVLMQKFASDLNRLLRASRPERLA